jgi:hypothetical protein
LRSRVEQRFSLRFTQPALDAGGSATRILTCFDEIGRSGQGRRMGNGKWKMAKRPVSGGPVPSTIGHFPSPGRHFSAALVRYALRSLLWLMP